MPFIHCLLDWKIGVFQQTVVSVYYIIKVIRYIASFLLSGSMRKFFSIDCVNIYLFLKFYAIDLAGGKVWVFPHFAYIMIH